ncbi:MAG: hypothetical protein PHU71_03875 [Candidatus Gracilibacteria bacterium]|nr:hypothetical protein [Candidatus Gracilibacteria bacterium]
MKRHESKVDFPGIAILVIALEVLAALALLFGATSSIFMMFTGEGTVLSFVLLSFGGICTAFLIFAIAEFLQLFLKIEFNTRKAAVAAKPAMKSTTRRRR